MGQYVQIPFAIGTYKGRSSKVLSEVAENIYFERNPDEAKSLVSMVGDAGLRHLATVGSGPCRGMIKMGAYLWIVSGQRLYRMSERLTVDDIGVIEGKGSCYMIQNGFLLGIVTNTLAYTASLAGVNVLPEQNLVGAAYQDGLGVYGKQKSERWFVSGLTDSSPGFDSIAALDSTTADTFPDQVVGVISDHRELVVFGETSIEFYVNAGLPAPGVPFARTQFVERGCKSGKSIAKADNSVYWLGDDLQVYSMAGYQPKVISTRGIHQIISAASSPETATSYIYTIEGHTYYTINFTHVTLKYDITEDRWTSRKSWKEERFRAEEYVYIWGKHIVGDFKKNRLYTLHLDEHEDDLFPMVREMLTPPLHGEGERMFMDELYIDVEMGVGTDRHAPTWHELIPYAVEAVVEAGNSRWRAIQGGTAGPKPHGFGEFPASFFASETVYDGTVIWEYLRQVISGADPQFQLSWSDDGGVTWHVERWRSMGRVGERHMRLQWYNLGSFRERMFKFTVSDPVKFVLSASLARMWLGESA